MFDALVIDSDAANRLSLAALPEEWVGEFNLPTNMIGIRRVVQGRIIYLIGDKARNDSRLLVIRSSGRRFFPNLNHNATLDCFLRILRVALSRFQPGIKLPVDWRIFHQES